MPRPCHSRAPGAPVDWDGSCRRDSSRPTAQPSVARFAESVAGLTVPNRSTLRAELDVPVTLIRGQHDRIHNPRTARRELGNGRFVEASGSGRNRLRSLADPGRRLGRAFVSALRRLVTFSALITNARNWSTVTCRSVIRASGGPRAIHTLEADNAGTQSVDDVHVVLCAVAESKRWGVGPLVGTASPPSRAKSLAECFPSVW